MAALELEVVTRTGPVVREAVDEVQAPSVAGEFGVLPGHVPLLAALRAGLLTYRVGGTAHRLAIGPGFAEVLPDRVLILVDRCAKASDLDRDAARTQLEAAEGDLDELVRSGVIEGVQVDDARALVDYTRAQLELVDGLGHTLH